jgi:hypothetical protein
MTYSFPEKVPEPGFYYHYKHDPDGKVNNYAYEVIGVGFHTESNRPWGEAHFVIYRPLYEASVYTASETLGVPCFDARPLLMWMEEVTNGDRMVPRFERILDSTVIAELEKIRSNMY